MPQNDNKSVEKQTHIKIRQSTKQLFDDIKISTNWIDLKLSQDEKVKFLCKFFNEQTKK